MASTSPRITCISCGKGTGLFKCEGCTQIFCTKHVVEHGQTLHHHTLQESIVKKKNHWMNFIDEWKEKSIAKIHQMAKETGEKLTDLAETHRSKNLKDDFFEVDLQGVPSSINIKEDQSAPLIYQLQVLPYPIDSKMKNDDDVFESSLDDVRIEDHGRLIIHNPSYQPIEVRGKAEYSSGIHQYCLQIEKNPLETWIFLGIISKSTPMTRHSYKSSSAYGWADYGDVFLAGDRQTNHTNGQFSHTKENDIICLEFDCAERTISYTNERTQSNQQLEVDLNKCPFPWQLHLNFYGEGDQVRLLSVMHNI